MFHPDAKPRCPVCGLHFELCGCEDFPRLEVRSRIFFLQHPEEVHKYTNSVRVACKTCPDFAILPWLGRTEPLNLPENALVLFPGPEVPVLTREESTTRPIVVLDGTWAQASRIFRILLGKGIDVRRLPEDVLHGWQARRSTLPERMSSAHAASLVLDTSGECAAANGLRETVDRVGQGFMTMRGIHAGGE